MSLNPHGMNIDEEARVHGGIGAAAGAGGAGFNMKKIAKQLAASQRKSAKKAATEGITPAEGSRPGESVEILLEELDHNIRNPFLIDGIIKNVLPAIIKQGEGQKALIEPNIDETKHMIAKDGIIPPDSALYGKLLENIRRQRITEHVTLDVNSSNTVDLIMQLPSGRRVAANDMIINFHAKKVKGNGVKIADEIESAVVHAFSGTIEEVINRGVTDISAFPIYLIGAFKDSGRHLTIAVFYDGIIYSCGVASAAESGTTMNVAGGSNSKLFGSAIGAATAAGLLASGVAPGMAAGISSAAFPIESSIGNATVKYRHLIGSNSSKGGQAQILAPDFMFKLENTRIFDIGILRPEHLVRLKAYFDKMTDDVICTFKKNIKAVKKNKKAPIGHFFDHFEFPLNARFAAISSPLVVDYFKNYLNCTTYVLSIFKDIDCGVAGGLIVDPRDCTSKKIKKLQEIDAKTGGIIGELISQMGHIEIYPVEEARYIAMPIVKRVASSFMGQTPASWLKYKQREVYVGLMFYRFVRQYLITMLRKGRKRPDMLDPTLFRILVSDHTIKTPEIVISEQQAILNNFSKEYMVASLEAQQTEDNIVDAAKPETAGAQPMNQSYGGGRMHRRRTCRRKQKKQPISSK